MKNERGISPIISTIILLATGISITLLVIAWATGIMGSSGYGTRPIKIGITSTLHGSGSMFIIYVRNFGGDKIFIDQIIMDGKYTGTVTAAFEISSYEDRLVRDVQGDMVVLKPGDNVAIYFTMEIPKEQLKRIFMSGSHHEIKIHTSLGYNYMRTVISYYIPHGSWTIRQMEDSEDGWILQGGHENWGVIEGILHMYILRIRDWSEYNGKIKTRARWVKGSGQFMVIIGYNGKGNGYALWMNFQEGRTGILRFEKYGLSIHVEASSNINIVQNAWYIIEITINGNKEQLTVKGVIMNSNNEQIAVLTANVKPDGPYVGLGYWENPKNGQQSIVQFDYIQLTSSEINLKLNFQNISEIEAHCIEEG